MEKERRNTLITFIYRGIILILFGILIGYLILYFVRDISIRLIIMNIGYIVSGILLVIFIILFIIIKKKSVVAIQIEKK